MWTESCLLVHLSKPDLPEIRVGLLEIFIDQARLLPACAARTCIGEVTVQWGAAPQPLWLRRAWELLPQRDTTFGLYQDMQEGAIPWSNTHTHTRLNVVSLLSCCWCHCCPLGVSYCNNPLLLIIGWRKHRVSDIIKQRAGSLLLQFTQLYYTISQVSYESDYRFSLSPSEQPSLTFASDSRRRVRFSYRGMKGPSLTKGLQSRKEQPQDSFFLSTRLRQSLKGCYSKRPVLLSDPGGSSQLEKAVLACLRGGLELCTPEFQNVKIPLGYWQKLGNSHTGLEVRLHGVNLLVSDLRTFNRSLLSS